MIIITAQYFELRRAAIFPFLSQLEHPMSKQRILPDLPQWSQAHVHKDCHRSWDCPLAKATGRKFNYQAYPVGFDLVTTDYDDGGNFTFIPCPDRAAKAAASSRFGERYHSDSIFVAVGGACARNGSPSARGAIGVYFAKDSCLNISAPSAVRYNCTSQIAELEACIWGLHVVRWLIFYKCKWVSQVIIKSDSSYLIKGMTEHVYRWRANGYKNHLGKDVVNADFFKMLDNDMLDLSRCGIHVRLWHVPCSRNQEADGLAIKAIAPLWRDKSWKKADGHFVLTRTVRKPKALPSTRLLCTLKVQATISTEYSQKHFFRPLSLQGRWNGENTCLRLLATGNVNH